MGTLTATQMHLVKGITLLEKQMRWHNEMKRILQAPQSELEQWERVDQRVIELKEMVLTKFDLSEVPPSEMTDDDVDSDEDSEKSLEKVDLDEGSEKSLEKVDGNGVVR